MNEAVLFEMRGSVAVATLNDEQRLNPLTPEIQAGLLGVIHRVHEDRAIRALLLTARGRGFCVGADLAEFGRQAATAGPDGIGEYVGRMMEETANPMIEGLRSLPVPVVCAVNGVAAGGGVGLALTGDVVLAARSAYFYLPFAPALGLVPDMGASWGLPRAVGRARAMGLALLGDKLDAERAAAWGLIWQVVDDAALAAESLAVAQRLAALPGHAAAEVRTLLTQGERRSLQEQLSAERERLQALIGREAFREGVRAFAEKRRPVFPGRDEK